MPLHKGRNYQESCLKLTHLTLTDVANVSLEKYKKHYF